MLTQTVQKFLPAVWILIFQSDPGRTTRHSLGRRSHSTLYKEPREDGRFPQPSVALGRMRTGSHTSGDNRTDSFRTAHSKLQSGISAHAQAHQMRPLNCETSHHGGYVVHR